MLQNAIAGGSAGACASVLTCPLDVVKTHLQFTHPPKYQGTFDGLFQIYKIDGFRGWYRGLTATLSGYLPSWATYFMVYEKSKSLLHPYVNSTSLNHILSSTIAGVSSTILTNPFWVVKTRFMVSFPPRTSLTAAFKQIYFDEGIKAFYKGLATSLLGISHATIQFPLYEQLKQSFLNRAFRSDPHSSTTHPKSLSFFAILVSSCVSKMCATLITYPHEVIRTRLHMQRESHESRYNSIRHCAATIYREEGFASFYRGLGANLLRTVPNSAITLFTFERLSQHLSNWCRN